jgi:hypothetical protein
MSGGFCQLIRTSPKAAVLLTLAAGLAGAAPAFAEDSATDTGVQAFREVCLASAPSFAKGTELAKKFGVKNWIPLGKQQIGDTADGSLSIQIQPGKECATTTQTRRGAAVHAQFMKTVAGAVSTPGITEQTKNPFAASAGGKPFIFGHDRNGGEAYVMVAKP